MFNYIKIIENNKIGDKGAEGLSKGDWSILRILYLRIQIIYKRV
jgi:hypothetical protein